MFNNIFSSIYNGKTILVTIFNISFKTPLDKGNHLTDKALHTKAQTTAIKIMLHNIFFSLHSKK